MIKTLWSFRHFVVTSIWGELKGRFARSKLGLLWSVLHPLAQATIFAVVLSEVLGAKLGNIDNKAAYPIYLVAGLAGWNLFTEILNRCLTIFVEYSDTLKKIAFPRLCLPLIIWGTAMINHILLVIAAAVVFAFLGHYPSASWLFLPIGMLLVSIFAFGLGVFLGILNVFTRDVAHFFGIVLQIWFWLTPIIYSRDIIPKHLQSLIEINPMTALVGIYQNVMLYQRWPDIQLLVYPSALAIFFFILSFIVFRRASSDMLDAL